jgi:RNA polymerase sigma factor (sigma-70 family)
MGDRRHNFRSAANLWVYMPSSPFDPRSDEQLLTETRQDPNAFGVFYRRHLDAVVRFHRARVREPELAADLAAETFAAALLASRRYRPHLAPASSWLYAIARHKLLDSVRRGRVEDGARRRLGMRPVELTDDDLIRVEEIAAAASGGGAALELLDELPEAVRAALGARVLDSRDYAEIATELRCSEQVVRKRVSRGLAQLRARLEEGE